CRSGTCRVSAGSRSSGRRLCTKSLRPTLTRSIIASPAISGGGSNATFPTSTQGP
ncbi:MAG: hypothetical protein AVDCRST_MAG14-1456, partial [uncultured Rubrobacteraceae bacterium]